ncbi:MAG: hypothetical protein B6242_11990 [Anaerolineaceae bacterium 4572_78]|nr:MAG: hypothetical protein B6242_11990 [Anaerolineaceae bacterium 4572_78]
MSEKPYRRAIFDSLVYSEEGELAEVTYIGGEAYYIILDDDFKRHVEAQEIDRQIVEWLQKQVFEHKSIITSNVMDMIGKDDLFTKAMIESSIKNVDKIMEVGIPDDARMMLGMMGFKVIVDFHGEVLKVDMPEHPID